MGLVKKIHERAVLAVKNLKRSEREVIDALIEVDIHRVFREMGYSTLHDYCVMGLKLSNDQAYTYIGVSRKSREFPELRRLINDGEIHLTNARTIVPVLTQENKADLLAKAKELSSRTLQREIVKSYPEKVTKERIRPVTETRLEMKVYITAELEKKLKRMQDVLSSKFKKHCSMEEVIAFMATESLERHDPVRKAQRAKPTTLVARQTGPARPIPAQVDHEVTKRDQAQCTFILPTGQRCPQRNGSTSTTFGLGHEEGLMRQTISPPYAARTIGIFTITALHVPVQIPSGQNRWLAEIAHLLWSAPWAYSWPAGAEPRGFIRRGRFR